jgi:hypothetical protein
MFIVIRNVSTRHKYLENGPEFPLIDGKTYDEIGDVMKGGLFAFGQDKGMVLSAPKLVSFLVATKICLTVRQLHLDIGSWSKLSTALKGEHLLDFLAVNFPVLQELSVASGDGAGNYAKGFGLGFSVPFPSIKVFRCNGIHLGPLFVASVEKGFPALEMLLVDSLLDFHSRKNGFVPPTTPWAWGVSATHHKRSAIDAFVDVAKNLTELRVLSMSGLPAANPPG